MAEEIRRLEDLLPYSIRDRFRYYLGFVNDRLFEVAKLEGLEKHIPAIRDEVELIFLLRLLYGYFVIGYRNYTSMLNYFKGMQVEGFQIGTTEFASTSRITLEWRQLATGMERLLMESEVAQYVRPTLSTDEVIRRILRSRIDERRESYDE
jgi:hypothetical protein